MSTAVVVPNGNHLTNGHANGFKSSAAKSRGALKRLKAKAKAKAGSATPSEAGTESERESDTESITSTSTAATSIEVPSLDPSDPNYAQFANIFAHFQEDGQTVEEAVLAGPKKGDVYYSDEEDEDEETRQKAAARAAEFEGMTRRERRKAAKLTVSELKQLVDRPEVVEWFDPDARDPRLLVSLKSYRNSVPVPVHWNAKRDYLAGKRGIEKPPYLLPPWIADTGIGEMRDAVKAKEAAQSLAQKTRERVQPKMGKIDIDYQKLHDAFFKFQQKPSMSKFGEAYYEGKELETDLRTKKPGELSSELIEALSIPPLAPPPWLIAMQRFGPPPSYPNLRIKGLNAPIPPGAQWGFHPGGWGKPPMDDFNRPLYGDVFGVMQGAEIAHQNEIDRALWGEIEVMEEEDEDEEEEEEEEEEAVPARGPSSGKAPDDGLQTPSGLATPSGFHSVVSTVPGGLETPDFIELRKNSRAESEDVGPSGPKELYQVIPERETSARGFLGSTTAYDFSTVGKGAAGSSAPVLGDERSHKRKAGDVDISVNVDEDLTPAQLKERYESSRAQVDRVHVPGADVDRSGFDDVVKDQMKKRAKVQEKKDKGRKEDRYKF
ncbi:hypothetical protein TREMEDRAFT_72698 [Tremella mesenterica DSM 1558]|uniref:uncharacterized protein n=1 Tax=Tremella mesenterica (strain ATCC 24925 / CBS 8224 / DSM 1558 / NBRC 9311 / NRRL Y-6157 / RJB 2259-6 / UBC 559-6) TaxID=578456 RepID=UPI0003F4A0C7|nr:uncharacterized protein TREMEDRAFT_72698 [Tremella mesenterica DSM 1558]EIW72250.1 hypothetical protein TREMEDRAFT_72698 [Tremella mesenterica DSM 1558]